MPCAPGLSRGLHLLVGLCVMLGCAQSALAAENWEILSGGFARQMGLPVPLDKESDTRLSDFVQGIEESIVCGREVCAEWETDSSSLLLALSSLRELRARGKSTPRLTVSGVILAHALHVALKTAHVPPGVPRKTRFEKESKEVYQLLQILSKEVLDVLSVHPPTIRAFLVSSQLEEPANMDGDMGAVYRKRMADDPLHVSAEEKLQRAKSRLIELLEALENGDKEGALSLIEEVAECIPRSPQSDYLMAFSALFERDSMRVMEALRRMDKRAGSTPLILQGQALRLGAIVARKARLTGEEIRLLGEVVAGEELSSDCIEKGVIMGTLNLPCVSTMTRDDAVKRLRQLNPSEPGSDPALEAPGKPAKEKGQK